MICKEMSSSLPVRNLRNTASRTIENLTLQEREIVSVSRLGELHQPQCVAESVFPILARDREWFLTYGWRG